MRNHSYENEFDLHENESAGGTHFHLNAFAIRLALKQRLEITRKWPITAVQPRSQLLSYCHHLGERDERPWNEVDRSVHDREKT